MLTRMERAAKLKNCTIDDGFWSYYVDLVCNTVVPLQEKIFNDEAADTQKSHALDNFRLAAGEKSGSFYGMLFQDSDVYKWLEAAAYALQNWPDAALEQRCDAVIGLICRAQEEDGYLNTYFTLERPNDKWTNLLEGHELYCAGHMIEAACAYFEVTGKNALLQAACRLADHIDRRFGPGKTAGIPGHEEIELALLRLWRVTGEKRYLDLAAYFVNTRGQDPAFFEKEAQKRSWDYFGMDPKDTEYNQSHRPVRRQTEAVGHSVRAMYLYTAMADLAAETNDRSLYDACVRLYENVTGQKMYVTGGIGSTVHGEAFTAAYDLPNDSAYAETCAAVGLVFFARKMLQISPKGTYADVMERCLYNGVLSGMQRSGDRFFYVNPLEAVQGLSGQARPYSHVLLRRPRWYTCACCPPNLARLIGSLGRYAWGEGEGTVYAHLLLGGEYRAENGAVIGVQSAYPWQGQVSFCTRALPENQAELPFTLAVHIPSWCSAFSLCVNGEKAAFPVRDGYCYIARTWRRGDRVDLHLQIEPRRVYANAHVRADAGCVCLSRGPLIYCFEACDNGEELHCLRLPRSAAVSECTKDDPVLGRYIELDLPGFRVSGGEALYSFAPPQAGSCTLRALPYYLWSNRAPGSMRVWLLETGERPQNDGV